MATLVLDYSANHPVFYVNIIVKLDYKLLKILVFLYYLISNYFPCNYFYIDDDYNKQPYEKFKASKYNLGIFKNYITYITSIFT